MVYIAASKNPFRPEDEITLYSFLGQVRDRLLYFVKDPPERMVPPLTQWILTGWDINKDIPVTDIVQLSAPNIQLKDASRVFRLYIKSLGDKAVYRVEEPVKMHSFIVDALQTVTRTKPSQDYTKYIQDPEMNLLTDVHDDWDQSNLSVSRTVKHLGRRLEGTWIVYSTSIHPGRILTLVGTSTSINNIAPYLL